MGIVLSPLGTQRAGQLHQVTGTAPGLAQPASSSPGCTRGWKVHPWVLAPDGYCTQQSPHSRWTPEQTPTCAPLSTTHVPGGDTAPGMPTQHQGCLPSTIPIAPHGPPALAMPVQTPVPAWGGCHPGATAPGTQSAPGAGCFVSCPCPNFISKPQGSNQSPLPACPGLGTPPWWPWGHGREPCCGGRAVPRVSPSRWDIAPGHLAGTPAGQPGGPRPPSLLSTLQRAHAAGCWGRGGGHTSNNSWP